MKKRSPTFIALLTIVSIGLLLYWVEGRKSVPPTSSSLMETANAPVEIAEPSPVQTAEGGRGSPETVNAEDGPSRVHESATHSPTQDPSSTAWGLVDSASTLREGLSNALAALGTDHPNYISVYMQAAAACERVDEQRIRYLASPAPAGIEWAFSELALRCDEFRSDNRLTPANDQLGPLLQLVQGKSATALSESRRILAASSSASEIIEAIEVLRDVKEFPLEGIFGAQSSLSEDDFTLIIRNAALLRECDFSRRCDSGSFPVLAYCAQNGCTKGRTLQSAMQDAMSPRSYAATVSLHRWLVSNRR